MPAIKKITTQSLLYTAYKENLLANKLELTLIKTANKNKKSEFINKIYVYIMYMLYIHIFLLFFPVIP